MKKGGRFTMSDDSHGVAQVGTNYDALISFIEDARLTDIVYFERGKWLSNPRTDRISAVPTTLKEVKEEWQSS